MNLRTLKKLSKRAAPLLERLGDRREQFAAEREESYMGLLVGARKHWERSRCHPSYEGRNGYLTPRGAEIVFTTRAGRTMVMSPPCHPRKGTIMVGGMDGGESPEWSEETAWDSLTEMVIWSFTTFDPDTDDLVATRTFRTPSEYLRGAEELCGKREGARR